MNINKTNRISEIDGIRGWAAISVLFFHLTWELFGTNYPELRNPAFRFFLDGPLAVCIFFILSGDALSICFTNSSGSGISFSMVVKRYFRLAGPILFSCIIVYVVMKLGWAWNSEAAKIINRNDWLGNFIRFEPSFLKMMQCGLIDVFSNHVISTSYNPFLWPMSIELFGSMLVFCFGFISKALKFPLTIALIIAFILGCLGSFYALFFIGISLGTLRARGFFEKIKQFSKVNLVITGMFILFFYAEYTGTFPLKFIQLQIVLSTSLVCICYSSNKILRWMKNRLSQFLGRISFPLYLIHFSVIISYSSWLIVHGNARFGSYFMFPVFVILSSALLALYLAFLMAIVEARYLKTLNNIMSIRLKKGIRIS